MIEWEPGVNAWVILSYWEGPTLSLCTRDTELKINWWIEVPYGYLPDPWWRFFWYTSQVMARPMVVFIAKARLPRRHIPTIGSSKKISRFKLYKETHSFRTFRWVMCFSPPPPKTSQWPRISILEIPCKPTSQCVAHLKRRTQHARNLWQPGHTAQVQG